MYDTAWSPKGNFSADGGHFRSDGTPRGTTPPVDVKRGDGRFNYYPVNLCSCNTALYSHSQASIKKRRMQAMCATTLFYLFRLSPLFFHPSLRKVKSLPPSGFLDELSLQVFRCCTVVLHDQFTALLQACKVLTNHSRRVPLIEKHILHLLQTLTKESAPTCRSLRCSFQLV